MGVICLADREKGPNGLKIIIITVVAVAVVLSGVLIAVSYYYSHAQFGAVDHAFTETSEYSAVDNYSIILTAQHGNVVLVPTNNSLVKVTAESWAYFFTSADVNINETASNNTFTFVITSSQQGFKATEIRLYAPTNVIARSFNISTNNGNINFNFQSSASSLSLDTTNGGITVVSELVQNVRGSTENGNIDVNLVQTNNVSLDSQNGGISMKVTDPIISGTQSIVTTNGGVTIQINPLSKLSLSAVTTNGAVSYSGLNIATSISTPSKLVGTLNGGGGTMSLATVNGGITISSI